MSIHKIYILAGAVHSGKTTTLQEWLRNKATNAGGILAPDINGKRCLYDIANDTYHEFEMDNDHPEEDTLLIGKYRFSKKTFQLAQEILLRAMHENRDWVIVDELGKLEIEGIGLEPALTKLIDHYKQSDTKSRLIIVVRDYLQGAAVDKYGLDTGMILHKAFFE